MNATDYRSGVSKPTRREFLYYLGGASLVLFSAGTCAVAYRFAQPRTDFRVRFDVYTLDLSLLKLNSPYFFREAQAFVVDINGHVNALDIHCTFPHERWRVVWVGVNERFECPICGSKYQLDGNWIAGPASRGMDRFVIWMETPHGIIHTPEDGSPISIDDATRLWVDTRTKIPGQPRE